jgi:acetyl-CoA carboxylase biotin carboxylase subunit
VHPGYGFLSENAAFARAVTAAGLTWIGPPAAAIELMGDKGAAKDAAVAAGVPVVPAVAPDGSGDPVYPVVVKAVAGAIGYPVLLKAAAGGGGRGMRMVESEAGMAAAFAQAHGEAEAAFGDGRLFLERYVRSARHVEVQVLGDAAGNVIHLGTRDCTLQRRYQKLIEEAPAPDLPDALRAAIQDAAVRLIGALDYTGAATCEFLVDPDRGTAGFLEINARLQVEHPVSEIVTGVDVVREMLRIAGGEGLSVGQEEVEVRGHAIEVRINAESPARDFAPTPGTLKTWVVPVGTDVRVDSACFPGWTVPPFYDSLLAKLIGSGPDREAALARTRQALRHLRVEGVETTAGFALDLLEHPEVVAGRVHTRWVEETFLPEWGGTTVAEAA